MVITASGASISRALSIAVSMTALLGPLLAAHSRAQERNYDVDPTWITIPFVAIAVLLFVMFLPAIREVAANGPSARQIWVGTVWTIGCLGAAHLLLAQVGGWFVLAFPAAAVAAAMGAIRINDRFRPGRAPSRV